MIIDQIRENKQLIKTLFDNGFVSFKVIISSEIYNYYEMLLKTNNKKTDAIQWTADNFKVSNSTVYRIIKKMEQ